MNIAVRYQSRGGNTRAMAEVIAETLGVKAESIDKPINGHVDILFIGGGVYKWDADPQLIKYLNKLDPDQIGQVVAFSTTGVMKKAVKRIIEYSKKAMINVCDKSMCLRMMLRGHALFGQKGGILTNKQTGKIRKFANEVVEGLKNN